MTFAHSDKARFQRTVPLLFFILFLFFGNPSALAATSVPLLKNGTFEDGSVHWRIYPLNSGSATSAGIVDLDNPYEGQWYAYVGDKTSASKNAEGVLRQDITIPASATQLRVSFWIAISSAESHTAAFDSMGVYLRNTADQIVATIGEWSNKDKDTTGNPRNYKNATKSVDVSSFRDQELILQFYAKTDANLYTTFRIDNVSVNCELEEATPTEIRITPLSSAGGRITPAEAFSVEPGYNARFSATPHAGFEFDHWEINGVRVSESTRDLRIRNIRTDTEVKAWFREQTFLLSVFSDTNGEFEISILNMESSDLSPQSALPLGSSRHSSYSERLRKGAKVALQAIPSSGYQFWRWLGGIRSTLDVITFEITGDLHLNLEFLKKAQAPLLQIGKSADTTPADIIIEQTPNWRYILLISSSLPHWAVWSSHVATGSTPVKLQPLPVDPKSPEMYLSTLIEPDDDSEPFLDFPLEGYTPYTAPVTAVFDNGPQGIDGSVVLLTGQVIGGTPHQNEKEIASLPTGLPEDNVVEYTLPSDALSGVLNYKSTFLSYDGHTGYDYSCAVGTEVRTAAEGKIVEAFNANDGSLVVEHAEGYRTYYLHLSEEKKNGINKETWKLEDKVAAGSILALSGATGVPGRPHLHFTVKKKEGNSWKRVDPYGLKCLKDGSYVRPRLWKLAPP